MIGLTTGFGEPQTRLRWKVRGQLCGVNDAAEELWRPVTPGR